MKKILTSLSALLVLLVAHSQNMIVQNGATLKTSGAVSLVLNNTGVQNSGTLDIASATLYVKGASNATLTSNSMTTLKRLIVDKIGTTVFLKTDLQIADSVVLKTGLLDLNGKNITLQPAAVVAGETETSRITGPLGGAISITAIVESSGVQQPGHLGLSVWNGVKKNDTITIMRSHKMQYGAGMAYSVLRTYDVYTKSNHLGNIRFAYFDAELNGLDENHTDLFKSTNNGANWQEAFINRPDIDSDFVERYGIVLSGRYTLSTLQSNAIVKEAQPAAMKATANTIQLTAYPNPAVQQFTVTVQKPILKTGQESDQLYVVDVTGHIVQQQKIRYNTPVKIQGLQSGVYFIKLASQQSLAEKVIVQ